MVLGLRSKSRKVPSLQVDYLVRVLEIKPWLSSHSTKSSQLVLLQWENADQIYGSLTSSVGDGAVEFDESFTLSTTLCREKKSHDKFQKNLLEFRLYESRKDKTTTGQLLGTAVINLADYGVVDKVFTITVPFNCKKSLKIAGQPLLCVQLRSVDKDSSNSSPKGSLSKQESLASDGKESFPEVRNEETDDEIEIASFTDDDVSSHSSRTLDSSAFEGAGDLPSQTGKDDLENKGRDKEEMNLPPRVDHETSTEGTQNQMPKMPRFLLNDVLSKSKAEESSHQPIRNKKVSGNVVSPQVNIEVHRNSGNSSSRYSKLSGEDDGRAPQPVKDDQLNSVPTNGAHIGHQDDKEEKSEPLEIGKNDHILEEKRQYSDDNLVGKFLASRKEEKLRSNTLAPRRKVVDDQGSTIPNGKLKHLKSVQFPNSGEFNGSSHIPKKVNKLDRPESDHHNVKTNGKLEIKEATNGSFDGKSELESKVSILEEELRETAAIEVGLYSVIAEHGSSINKVHAPARRLSRFYLHACNEKHRDKRANAAKAAISGLVLVSKACGNDVPRLTFWLSNSVMLRGIVTQAIRDESPPTRERKTTSVEEFDDWQDPETFIVALEKVEAWIFTRIIESVWWQTFTPHMQSTATNTSSRSITTNSRKSSGSKSVLGNQEQGNFSVELWKKAFKDACERLCPIRAGGHECGCLPALARLVMEQLVARLDVAMFNAILRESDEDMPTDPLSDPIGDLRVLPVPAGRSSFGAGAQLKNAIGCWSRWLTDLFGIEDNDSPEDDNSLGDEDKVESRTPFKPFRLLNALSDLMMLPFEMLADKSTRKEVCPTFSAPLIKRVAYSFVPDEFCPNPVPETVLEALDTEDDMETSEASLTSFPCIASPSVYSPPPAASLSAIIGQVGSQALSRSASSLLTKSYTSDDELDELDSPFTSIVMESTRVSPTSKGCKWMPKGGRSTVRYKLLREVWRHGE